MQQQIESGRSVTAFDPDQPLIVLAGMSRSSWPAAGLCPASSALVRRERGGGGSGAAAVVVLYVCALVIYQFEHDAQPEAFASVLDAMWWAAVTLTTVGYGDIYPVTPIGRLFTVLMLFVALGIIAIPTGLVASALSAIRAKEAAAEDREAARPSATSRN